MSNRYYLSQTDSPRPAYRVIDGAMDNEPALHPAALPSGDPHPLAGQPVSTVTSPDPSRPRPDEGRARTWGEVGGRTVAVIERVPAWATTPVSAVLGRDPHAFDGTPDDLVHSPSGGPSVLTWFAVLTGTGDHLLPRWQDRYAAAALRAPSAREALSRLQGPLRAL